MNLEKIKPWNWFKKETRHSIPVGQSETPMQSILNLRHELDNLFNGHFPFAPWLDTNSSFNKDFSKLSQTILRPKLDISETKETYHITVEVPGIEENDISLHLDQDGILTIKGEKKFENKQDDKQWHSVERAYGSFQRVLALPEDANRDLVDAKFKNGVLSIDISRHAESEPSTLRRIKIQSDNG